MRQAATAWLLLLTGCSTAPFADLMDYFHPGRVTGQAPPTGGVCIPQGGPVAVPAVVPPVPIPPQPLLPVPPAPPTPGGQPLFPPAPGRSG